MFIGARFIVIVKEQWCKRLAQMPLRVIGQHVEEDMRTDAIGEVVVDRPDFLIDAFVATEDPFDMREIFIGTYGLRALKHLLGTLVRMT